MAAERSLRDGASGIALVFGRSFGAAQQTWTTYTDAGGQWVSDLTLSEIPFPAAAYLAAIHGAPFTRVEIPDERTLAALHEAIEAGAWDEESPAEFIQRLAPR